MVMFSGMGISVVVFVLHDWWRGSGGILNLSLSYAIVLEQLS